MNSVVLFPVNLYGPRDNFDLHTSHVIPAMIRKFVSARERGDARGRAVGRRLAHARVPVRRGRRRGDPAGRREVRLERPGEPGQRRGDLDPRAGDVHRRAPPVSPAASSGIPASPTASRGVAWTSSRAKERFGFTARTPFSLGIAQTVKYYEAHQREIEAGDGAGRRRRGQNPERTQGQTDEESAHHRDHRTGRLVSGRVAARKGVRGPRRASPLELLQHRAARADLPGSARARTTGCACTTAISTTAARSGASCRRSAPTRSTTWARRATCA